MSSYEGKKPYFEMNSTSSREPVKRVSYNRSIIRQGGINYGSSK